MRARLRELRELLAELRAMAPRDGRRIVERAHRADVFASRVRLLLLALLLGLSTGLSALPEVRWVS